VSDDQETIEREIFIKDSPETVFRFLIDPRLMARWIGQEHTLEARAGGRFCVKVSDGHVARGRFTEVVPNRRVSFTWGWDSTDPSLATLRPGQSLVEIELEAREGGTLLRLRHSRLPKDVSGVHGDRWSYYLERLCTAVCELPKEAS